MKNFFAKILAFLLNLFRSKKLGSHIPKYFGYYYGNPEYLTEQLEHVNLWWSVGIYPPETPWWVNILSDAHLAKMADIKCFVIALPEWMTALPINKFEQEFTMQLTHLQIEKVFDMFEQIVFYPFDEPDLHGVSNEKVVGVNTVIRKLYPNAIIGVIYTNHPGALPGLKTFDWVGMDEYNLGCKVTDPKGMYDTFSNVLLERQQLMIIAGGANPWKTDPTCFKLYASKNPKIVVVLGFMWQDVFEMPNRTLEGIRTNGLRPRYEDIGHWVTQR